MFFTSIPKHALHICLHLLCSPVPIAPTCTHYTCLHPSCLVMPFTPILDFCLCLLPPLLPFVLTHTLWINLLPACLHHSHPLIPAGAIHSKVCMPCSSCPPVCKLHSCLNPSHLLVLFMPDCVLCAYSHLLTVFVHMCALTHISTYSYPLCLLLPPHIHSMSFVSIHAPIFYLFIVYYY